MWPSPLLSLRKVGPIRKLASVVLVDSASEAAVLPVCFRLVGLYITVLLPFLVVGFHFCPRRPGREVGPPPVVVPELVAANFGGGGKQLSAHAFPPARNKFHPQALKPRSKQALYDFKSQRHIIWAPCSTERPPPWVGSHTVFIFKPCMRITFRSN